MEERSFLLFTTHSSLNTQQLGQSMFTSQLAPVSVSGLFPVITGVLKDDRSHHGPLNQIIPVFAVHVHVHVL